MSVSSGPVDADRVLIKVCTIVDTDAELVAIQYGSDWYLFSNVDWCWFCCST